MPIVLSQKRLASTYDDELGVRYHFPAQYRRRLLPGERFVYYHPREREAGDGRQYYFGEGQIGGVRPGGEGHRRRDRLALGRLPPTPG